MSIIVGIDPGVSGGISFFSGSGVHVQKLPQPANELLELLEFVQEDQGDWIVQAYVEQIYLRNNSKGNLTFASGWGKILGVLDIAYIPTTLVRPQVWMKRLDCLTKGDKNVTKDKATELFGEWYYPDDSKVPLTHWSSDALLIGYYGWLQEQELKRQKELFNDSNTT